MSNETITINDWATPRKESILAMAESLGLCAPGPKATRFDFLDAKTGEVFTPQQVWNLYHGRPAGEPAPAEPEPSQAQVLGDLLEAAKAVSKRCQGTSVICYSRDMFDALDAAIAQAEVAQKQETR